MNSVKFNFGYNIIYQVLIIFIPLITTPYLSRILGPVGLGEYSFSFSVADYFALIAMLGIRNYGCRAIALCANNRKRISIVFWSIYTIQFISSIIILFTYIVYIAFFVTLSAARVAIIYEIATFFDISWFFFGIEKFKITVTRSVVVKILSVILIFLLVKSESDVCIYMMIMTGSVLISNILLWIYIWNYIDKVRITYRIIKIHIKPILILFIPTLAIGIYHVMDKIMLGILGGLEQVGYYENSEKIVILPYSIITALGTVMLPRMSNLTAKGKIHEVQKYISNTIEFVSFLGVAMTFGIAAISPHLIPVLLGRDFLPCVNLLIMLSPLILIKSWANVIRTQYLLPHEKDKEYIKSVIVGAVINLLINFLLIPVLGAFGAVIGTLIAEFSVCFYQTFSIHKDLPIKKYIINNMWFIVIGLLMFIIVRRAVDNLNPSITSILICLIVGILVYVLLCLMILIIKKDTVLLPEVMRVLGMKNR